MNIDIDILLGIVYLFGSMVYLFHTFVPDSVPRWLQRVSYLALSGTAASFAYDILVLGV